MVAVVELLAPIEELSVGEQQLMGEVLVPMQIQLLQHILAKMQLLTQAVAVVVLVVVIQQSLSRI